jgi:hypothetical protein
VTPACVSRRGAETVRCLGVGDSGLFCGRLLFDIYLFSTEACISSSPLDGEAVDRLFGGVGKSSSHAVGDA